MLLPRPLLSLAALAALIALGSLNPAEAEPDTQSSAPGWVLPVESARAQAKRVKKPLLLVSLNGNLDGYC